MRPALHAFFAVLAAIVTMVAVFAIKRGVEWQLQGASDMTLNVLLALLTGLAVGAVAWTCLLRPMIDRRKQAQEARLRERPVRDVAGD